MYPINVIYPFDVNDEKWKRYNFIDIYKAHRNYYSFRYTLKRENFLEIKPIVIVRISRLNLKLFKLLESEE